METPLFGIDEYERNVSAILLAVSANDVLRSLVPITVVVRVVPATHRLRCNNIRVRVVVRDQRVRWLPLARVELTYFYHGEIICERSDNHIRVSTKDP